MTTRPSEVPVIRVEWTCVDGTLLERDWTIEQAGGASLSFINEPPVWLGNRSRAWDHPQDPVTYRGAVDAGREDDARKLLGL